MLWVGTGMKTTSGASKYRILVSWPSKLCWGALRHTDRVVVGELELQAIGLVAVERIIIHYLDVHKPGIEVLSLDKCDAWW